MEVLTDRLAGSPDVNGAEAARLAAADAGEAPWRAWGPYLAERAWGSVREDYSDHGTAWAYFPHDHARSRTYRWNEDGLGGVCDDRQTFCFAFAFWNGRDSIIKERIFGLTGPEGNHGEDAKEYWWYLDSTPTHSYMRWRYHYPQERFPYEDLVHTAAGRGQQDPEYELVDTGVFADDRYWAVTVDYAKASPTDMCIEVTIENRGPEADTLHVLPTLWFRNTWSWGLPGSEAVPTITGRAGALDGEHRALGRVQLAGDGAPEPLVCDNETNAERLWGRPGGPPYPKDGINDFLVDARPTVNPDHVGTKAALHYTVDVPAGGSRTIRLRLAQTADQGRSIVDGPLDLQSDFETVLAGRRAEADAFFADLTPAGASADEALVLRQAVASLMWGKQFYHWDVARWLAGDPSGGRPLRQRNTRWGHMNSFDVISMPDPWEYPWFAAWDLAFHCVAIARVDPGFAKQQILLLLREWYMHPDGQLPAYEWALDDVNPPVHCWAALRVFELDGSRDYDFLEKVVHRLLMNFTWWVNAKQIDDLRIYGGGFLGLDNVGAFDRGVRLPPPAVLAQADGTAWVAMYALNLLEACLVLAQQRPSYVELATTFLEHFAAIARAGATQGLWDEQDEFFYDVLRLDHRQVPMKVRSVVGLLPLAATAVLSSVTLSRHPEVTERLRWLLGRPEYASVLGARRIRDGQQQRLLAMVGPDRLFPVLARMLDEDEFLSPYGLRSLSRAHLAQPFAVRLGGYQLSADYQPGESRTGMFGGNSNWRGPVWFPVNYIIIEGLRRFAEFFGDDTLVEYPTGSGSKATFGQIADDLSARLVRLFLLDGSGRRPVHGEVELFQRDPRWRDLIPFHEYFHGDTGAGLGAAHQTGWTALVIDLIMGRHPQSEV